MTQSVIVIDDDEDTVRLFSEFLEENEIHVAGKGYDGKTAVELYKEKKPDCVLIDIMMPNGSCGWSDLLPIPLICSPYQQ